MSTCNPSHPGFVSADPPAVPEGRTIWSATAALMRSHSEGAPLRAGTRRLQGPLSFAQERLWFLYRANPQSAAYNVSFGWRIVGPLSIPALQSAVNRIVQRHTIFQTRFQEINGVPMQVVDSPPSIIVTTDLVGIEDFATQPFDLARLPLIRANVLVCGEEEFFLTIVVHHIVFDGWSRGLFLRELNAEYLSVMRGVPSAVSPPAVQYLDYAGWHREWLSGGVIPEQMPYWRNRLRPANGTGSEGSAIHSLQLSSDYPRSSTPEGSGAALFFSLPPLLYQGIERLRKEKMTTRYVVLLAAFQALLHRYTGEEDIVIGSVAAGRNRPEIRNVIGLFVNTLVLRTHVSRSMRFRDLLAAVEETARGAFAHQEVPFERLVAELKPERAGNRSPLFQIMFALQNAAHTNLQLAGTTARFIPVHNGCAKFDLSVELSEQPGRVAASIEFNTALFSRETVHRMARNFAVLLQGAIDNPECELRHLPLLSPAQERQLVISCNDTLTSYPRDLSVPALFAEVAQRQPEAVALADAEAQWTYADLDTRSTVIAAALRRAGIRRGTLVALAAARRPETVAAMLGILKAGGAYVPIDTSAPVQRIEFMLQDCGAPVVLAQKDLFHVLPSREAHMLCLDDLLAVSVHAPSQNVHAEARLTADSELCPKSYSDCGPDDLAYVLYTSGSTGNPKGVCVPHRAIVRLVKNTNYIRLGDNDVVAQAASLAFDAATFEVWGALLNGARLEFLQQDVMLAPSQLGQVLRRGRVTTLFLTTSVFNLVAAHAPDAFSSLHTLLFGGEVADPSAVRAVLAHGRPKRLLNVYGPTETTTFATWHEIANLSSSATVVPIGIPISNTQVHVLDPDSNLVPTGVRGEIYIGGDGVALGYLRRPELNAERFVHRELGSARLSQRLYRTGDFAIRRADGVIEFVGRADDQVKIRGFRIELHEIELALRKHPAVTDCCVVARENPSAGRQLAAYVVVAEDQPPLNARPLRAWLAATLPDYMIPAFFVFLPRLPLNSNGKVDRAGLPEPDAAPVASGSVAPWIPLHLQLIELWQEILQVNPIGLRDDFFELGGHSLLAVRLMDRIEQVCGKRLPISTLFNCATIEKLAAAIIESDCSAAPLIEVQAGGFETPVFFLHGDLFGGGLFCRQLARQLGAARPFFALPPHRPANGDTLPPIESIAAEHLRAIRERRPHGPYIVGGFCVSALIALEVAQELRRCGEEVELLVMLDPPAPRSLWWLRRWIECFGGNSVPRDRRDDGTRSACMAWSADHQRVAEFSRAFNQVYRARELWSQDAARKLAWLKRCLRRNKTAVAPAPPDVTFDSIAGAYLWATAGYRPAPYTGEVVAICCDSVMGSSASRIKQWTQYVGHLNGCTVDCKHLELVTTYSAGVAALLRDRLASTSFSTNHKTNKWGTCFPASAAKSKGES